MTIIDGKKMALEMRLEIAREVRQLKKNNIVPMLAVVLIGENKASKLYVLKKEAAAKEIGIAVALYRYPSRISETRIISELKKIQQNSRLSGLIIQLPMPENFYPHVINAIDPLIDVDCLTETNLGKLVMGTDIIAPPTPSAVMAILRKLNVSLRGKNATIVGTGVLVGKPLAIMLMNSEASVTTVNAHTKDIVKKCLSADIIISAVGKKDVIRGNMVKKGAIVIDAGVDFVEGRMFGDVCFEEVKKKAAYLTPTPGGVGPLTVAALLKNTVICAKMKAL